MKKRLTNILLACFAFLFAASCGGQQVSQTDTLLTAESSDAQSEDLESGNTALPGESQALSLDVEIYPGSLPIVDEIHTLSYYNAWQPANPSITQSIEDYLAVQKAEEWTNVHIDWTMIPSESYAEQFNIAIAAGDDYDMYGFVDTAYGSGVAGALNDGIIINIADYLPIYAPDYSARIDEIDYGWAQVSVEDDVIGAVYTLMDTETYQGLVIRGDWLKELNLEAPETYDEYYEVLTAMKMEYGAYGYCLSSQCVEFYAFAAGYGTPGYSLSLFGSGSYWYQVDGEVKCALIEDGFRQYLETMNLYYQEGLISPDFMSVSEMPNDSDKLIDYASGVYACFAVRTSGNGLDTIYDLSEDDDFELIPLSGPVQETGDVVHFSGYEPITQNALSTSVSASCENPELAVAWLNFWYSEEGAMLGNFGVEGVTYELIDEKPVYTDLILNNEYGLSLEMASQLYVPTGMISNIRMTMESTYTDHTRDAIAVWSAASDHEYVLPMINLTTEEIEVYNRGINDIETFAQENIPAFINGDKSFDEWDSYVDTLIGMGLEEKISLYQAAFDRMK